MTLRQRFSNNRGAIIGSCAGIAVAGVLLSSVPTLREEIMGLESKQVTTLANVLLAKGNGGHRSCALLEAPQYRKNCVDTTDAFLAADRSLNDAKTNLSS